MRWTNENTWDAAIQRAANQYGVDPALIKAIIGQESAFRPTAYRVESAIGDASIGLMQILYGTAKGEGYTGAIGSASTLTGLYNPDTNIMFGTSYLVEQIARTGSIDAAISAYNGGYRPDLGFGQRATKALTICLARDATGKCISTRNVRAGEFANQPYVDAVLANYAYFRNQSQPTILPDIVVKGGTSPPLIPAHPHDEPESGGHSSRAPVGTSRRNEGTAFVTQLLSVVSAKKSITIIGVILAGLGFLCMEHRADLDAIVSASLAGRICAIVAFLGTVMASLGKGIADRRGVTRTEGYYAAPKDTA